MILSIFVLAGAAISISSLFDNDEQRSDDDGQDDFSEDVSETRQNPNHAVNQNIAENSVWEDPVTTDTLSLNTTSSLDSEDSYVTSPSNQSSANMLFDDLSAGSQNLMLQNFPEASLVESEIYHLDAIPNNVEGSTSLISDFTSDPNLVSIPASDSDYVLLNLNEEGSLRIVQADYYERVGIDGDDRHVLHTGANVYYVPEGENYPENLHWSESTASMHFEDNNLTGQENVDSADQGNVSSVSLLARIETGVLYEQIDSQMWNDFATQEFADLQRFVISNASITFASAR